MSFRPPVLNALDFAAKDSATSGIQEAIDALPKTGGIVRLPTGMYRLRRSIELRSHVTLRGEGPATVLTRAAAVTITPLARSMAARDRKLYLKNARGLKPGDELCLKSNIEYGWHSRHVVITELKGNTAAVKVLSDDQGRRYMTKNDAYAANWFPALWILDKRDVTLEAFAIDGGVRKHARPKTDFTVAAVHTRNSHHLRVLDLTVRDWPGDGIGIQGGEDALVRGCLVENTCGPGLHPGTSLMHSQWVENTAKRCTGDGYYFCRGVRNTVCQGNLFHDNLANGIGGLSDPDRFNVVANNICAYNGKHGIDAPEALGNTIQGNLCRNNSQSEPGRYAGIHLDRHRENIVRGNQCIDDQPRHTQLDGVVAVDPLGENIIADNTCFLAKPSAYATGPEIRQKPPKR